MKKKIYSMVPALMLGLLTLAACSGSDNNDNNDENTENGDGATAQTNGRTLVVYFSKTLPDGVDATTGATDVVRENGTNYGANQYLALMIANKIKADTLRLTVSASHYPLAYSELATFARSEKDNNSHPALTSRTVNMADYSNIIISTPIWWYTIPMPVYSFLDAYDLSGKRVFVATTHAGSGLADAITVIRREEPGATVSPTGFSVRASGVQQNISGSVDAWLRNIGF